MFTINLKQKQNIKKFSIVKDIQKIEFKFSLHVERNIVLVHYRCVKVFPKEKILKVGVAPAKGVNGKEFFIRIIRSESFRIYSTF